MDHTLEFAPPSSSVDFPSTDSSSRSELLLSLLHQWLARRYNLLERLLARQNRGTSHKTLSFLFSLTGFGLIRLYHEYSSLGSRLYLIRISKKKRILRTLLCLSNYLVWAIALYPPNMCATLSWPCHAYDSCSLRRWALVLIFFPVHNFVGKSCRYMTWTPVIIWVGAVVQFIIHSKHLLSRSSSFHLLASIFSLPLLVFYFWLKLANHWFFSRLLWPASLGL